MPKKTQFQFEQEIQEIFEGKYIVLGEYINNKTPILIKHSECGKEFLKIPKDMISKKSGCPYCFGNKKILYNEEWVKENTPLPYHYVKNYMAMKQKCVFYCDNCKTEFEQMPSRLINQHIYGCNCCRTKKKTHTDFINELEEKTKQDYTFLSAYINTDTKIKIQHNVCKTIFELEPDKFLHRYHQEYCPICYYKKSKGEIKISTALNELKINYQKEYNFKDLPKLRFDFYLPDLNTCIEFDGKQHYEINNFFGGEEAFKKLKENDILKNCFCISNNIILYRIPYNDIDNIYYILNQIFKEKSSETIEKYRIY